MTVRELIEDLQKEDPEALVVMARDAEGNGYSPLHSFWIGAYRAESTWSGEVGLLELTETDIDAGYGEEDVIEDGEKAIVMSPVN